MTKLEMANRVARVRGFEDAYTILIYRVAEDLKAADREVMQMMYDILLGISLDEEWDCEEIHNLFFI